jgi:hypothetical protein
MVVHSLVRGIGWPGIAMFDFSKVLSDISIFLSGAPTRERAAGVVAPRLDFVTVPGPRGDLIKEALGIPVEIAQPFGLQAVGAIGIRTRFFQTRPR